MQHRSECATLLSKWYSIRCIHLHLLSTNIVIGMYDFEQLLSIIFETHAYLVCFLRWSRLPKRLPHVWQGKGRCPVCMRLWRVNSSFLVNVFPQFGSSHLKGLSPVERINNFKIRNLSSIIYFKKIAAFLANKFCLIYGTNKPSTHQYECECGLWVVHY